MNMKPSRKILLLLFAPLAATFGAAQTNLYPYVQHVIVVVQENRSPDNLFNEDSTLIANGGHVQPNLAGHTPNSGPCFQNGTDQYVTLQPNTFYTCWDPDHSHGNRGTLTGAWTTTWHKGAMDGACNAFLWWKKSGSNNYCGTQKQDEPPCGYSGPNGSNACPYTYVDNAF